MKHPILLFFSLLIVFVPVFSAAQCVLYPVTLPQRTKQATFIVQGTVVSKTSYTQASTGNIYTVNIFAVGAWLKGSRNDGEVAVITLGGADGNRAMQVEPSLQLELHKEYLLFLQPDNKTIDNKQLRLARPGLLQLLPYADGQGALVAENHIYRDLLSEAPQSEDVLFGKIEALTGQKARTPSGFLFLPRKAFKQQQYRSGGITTVTGFTPTTTNSGTVDPGDYLTITGSGFGATRGSGYVAFSNADDGGSTFILPAPASDYISWSDNSITVKVPRRAGTGNFVVVDNGGINHISPSPLTVNYAHLNIESSFFNFGTATRQRYYLRNLNTLGGYTFTYNATFNSNTSATAAFQRALNTWRCGTDVNFRINASTTPIAAAANDNVNVVCYDATLPAGVLARATTYFSGSAIPGVCELSNTVWWAEELDIVFNEPPFTGFTWQYGPAAPGGSQFDFQSVALHEIGHLHGLGHIIAPGSVMHYAISNGVQARTLGARDLDAGVTKMAYSTAATCFDPAASGSPMVGITGGCALPLQLLKFEGRRNTKSENLLGWTTIHELNNSGFELERSADGILFKKIAFIKGTNGAAENNYSYSDQLAGVLPWYYRLKQIDENGRASYTSTVFIKGDDSKQWLVWANETGSQLIMLNNGNVVARLDLFNQAGQLLLSQQISGGTTVIETGSLPKGLCFYRVIQNGQAATTGTLLLGGR